MSEEGTLKESYHESCDENTFSHEKIGETWVRIWIIYDSNIPMESYIKVTYEDKAMESYMKKSYWWDMSEKGFSKSDIMSHVLRVQGGEDS